MIDFHCHLDLYSDPPLAVEDADRAGIYVLSVTTTPKAWTRTLALSSGRTRIRTALGLHPELAGDRVSELPLFEHFATQTKYFGEIGLDGSPQFRTSQEAQTKVFRATLQFAERMGGRILSIHSRRASDDVLSSLAAYPNAGTPILHWFSGSQAQLRRAVAQGCWFSCGPAMLRSPNGRAIAKAIPKDKMLTETDGPFALEGTRPLQPADSWRAVEMLAKIWETSRDEVIRNLRQNLKMVSASVSDVSPAAG